MRNHHQRFWRCSVSVAVRRWSVVSLVAAVSEALATLMPYSASFRGSKGRTRPSSGERLTATTWVCAGLCTLWRPIPVAVKVSPGFRVCVLFSGSVMVCVCVASSGSVSPTSSVAAGSWLNPAAASQP